MKHYTLALAATTTAAIAAAAYAGNAGEYEQPLLTHMRVYLSSVVYDAESISRLSPLSTEEIRSQGIDLIHKIKSIREDGGREKFFKEFKDAYEKIFPEDGNAGIDAFRSKMASIMADIDDALPNIANGNKKEMRADLADLQSRLQLVAEQDGLAEWLTRFDLFSSSLLELLPPAGRDDLKGDVEALLTGLASYLTELGNMGIATGTLPRETGRLLDELKKPMSDAEFNELMSEVVELMANAPSGEKSPPL